MGLRLRAQLNEGQTVEPDDLVTGGAPSEPRSASRHSGSRELIAAVASSDFSPSPEEIQRFSSGGSGQARLTLQAGMLWFGFELHPEKTERGTSERSQLLSRLPAGVGLRPWPDLALPAHACYLNLRLRRKGGALRLVGLEPDPLSVFAAYAASVGDEERVDIGLAWQPLTTRQAVRWVKEQAQYTNLSEIVGASLVLRRAPKPSMSREAFPAGALLYLHAWVGGFASSQARASELAQGAARCFDQYRGRSWFEPHRASSRITLRSVKWARQVVGATEIGGLLLPPKETCLATNVVRSGGYVPSPPAGLATYTTEDTSLIPLGHVREGGARRLVGWPWEGLHFGYLAGRTRTGKSEMATCIFLARTRAGSGGGYLDPDRDAVRRLARYFGDCPERVVYINLKPDEGEPRLPGWNPIAVRSADEVEERVADVTDAFATAMRWGEKSNRAMTLTGWATQSLCELALQLPPEDCPTIFQIATILAKDEWRLAVLPHLSQAARDFWEDEYPNLQKQHAQIPVANVIHRLRLSPSIVGLLGSSVSTYSAREAMDSGKVVLICPGTKGKKATRLLTIMLATDMIRAGLSRDDIRPEERREFVAMLDEVQMLPQDAVADGLEHGGKFRFRIIALNQSPARLPEQSRLAFMTNSFILAAGGMDSHGAAMFSKEWQGRVSAGAIMDLELRQFVVALQKDRKWTVPFKVEGVGVEELWGPGDPEAAEALSSSPGSQSASLVLSQLETLDARILSHLAPVARERARTRSTIK